MTTDQGETMTTKLTVKLIEKDNGYFEVWQCPVRGRVRVITEYDQYRRRQRGGRAAAHAAIRARLTAKAELLMAEQVTQ